MTKIEPVKAWAVVDPRKATIKECHINRDDAEEALRSWFQNGHRIKPAIITIQENDSE